MRLVKPRSRLRVVCVCVLVVLGGVHAGVKAGSPGAPPPKTGETIPNDAVLTAGPWTIERTAGAPNRFTFTFKPCDPAGRFWLKVMNGPAGEPAVASAVVTLNGSEVFGPSVSDGRPAEIARALSVRDGGNELGVELRGKPGAAMELSVYAVQRCLRVELPTPPPGGYMPPDPVRWASFVWVEGRVKSSSPWWVELCACASRLDGCGPLDDAKIRPLHERTSAYRERGLDPRLGLYCGPEAGPGTSYEELPDHPPGWWSAQYLSDVTVPRRNGAEGFGFLIPARIGSAPYDQFALLVFNEAGQRLVHTLMIQTHPRLDPKYRPGTDGWTLFWERHDEASPPFLRVRASMVCGGTHFEIDWDADGVADVSMPCGEFERLESPDARPFLYHDFTRFGFHTPTIVHFRAERPYKIGIAVLSFESRQVERNDRGVVIENSRTGAPR